MRIKWTLPSAARSPPYTPRRWVAGEVRLSWQPRLGCQEHQEGRPRHRSQGRPWEVHWADEEEQHNSGSLPDVKHWKWLQGVQLLRTPRQNSPTARCEVQSEQRQPAAVRWPAARGLSHRGDPPPRTPCRPWMGRGQRLRPRGAESRLRSIREGFIHSSSVTQSPTTPTTSEIYHFIHYHF